VEKKDYAKVSISLHTESGRGHGIESQGPGESSGDVCTSSKYAYTPFGSSPVI
jgi:hypothetical protein